MRRALPEPEATRWKPLRAGLIDLFYYDREELWFRDGRLLLRGNNGTGKSKVLALTLPFLLDGDVSPHRVEPDADPKKRMEWNLLLGGEHPHPERLGYSWLEFGRHDDDGTSVFCTLGCGLKAVRDRGIVATWFFVTEQRIGAGLELVDAAQVPLTRERLEEAIGAQGSVHRTAREHRRAVDESLFGLGEQRYGALVDLLIRIRAPQLSKRPSEKALSGALTEALPPLDRALVADVAEAFRSLEDDREELTAMIEARDASTTYLDTYRSYAQIACRRRAAPSRRAQTSFDRVSRELADAEEALSRARRELAAAEDLLERRGAEEVELSARERALGESPEARSAAQLTRAQTDAQAAEGRVQGARGQLEQAASRLDGRRVQRDDVERRRSVAAEQLGRVRAEAVEAARAALVADAFVADVDHPLEGSLDIALDTLSGRANGLVERQARAVKHVRELHAVVDERERELRTARSRREQLAGDEADLATRREEAGRRVQKAAHDVLGRAREHVQQATALELADSAALLAALELWGETLDGPNPYEQAVRSSARAVADRLAHAEAGRAVREGEARVRHEQLAEAIARLETGEHDAPEPPHTRDRAAREGRAGAALWQLVDFRDDVDDERRAGIEAALEAAGILDAWVDADGQLADAPGGDVRLAPGSTPQGPAATLADVLQPAIDVADPHARQVPHPTVERLLAAIALDGRDGSAWVDGEGRFGNGVLRGAWRKPAARFIGHGAREAARRARLEELGTQRADVERELEALRAERGRLEVSRAQLDEELSALPDDAELRGAHHAVAALVDEAARLAERVAEAERQLAEATDTADMAERTLRDGAGELRLPHDHERLDEVGDALVALRTMLAALWPAVDASRHFDAEHARAHAELAQAERDLAEQAVRLREAEHEHAQLAARHATLAATVGAAVEELHRQLAAVAEELRENRRQREQADRRRLDAKGEEGRQNGLREQLTAELERVTVDRLEQVETLRRFAGTGLVAVALPDLDVPPADGDWGVTAALRFARQIEQGLAGIADDDSAWNTVQRHASEELNVLADALRRHGHNASAQIEDDALRVEVVFRGHATTVPAVAGALEDEVRDREQLLNEREREILENHLVNEIASTLQELIASAEVEVGRMNAELAERPTSTGMRLRLVWRPVADGPPGLAVARERLLRQTADAWSEADRAAVGEFLQAQIQDVRARDIGGTWVDQLTEALDYRAWHEFRIERHQGGRWRSATGPASGGERVLAASVPLFAAASAHCASATNPHAPRIVLLDEAFAGVDDDARAKCLGLLTAFDLDVVMTSEREWGCYPEVPGLAIAQLTRVQDIPAVLVTRWEWDGVARTRVDDPVLPPLPDTATDVAVPQEGLWAPPTASD